MQVERLRMRAAIREQLQVDLAVEIRQLAREMVRLEDSAHEAASRSQFDQVGELYWQRELCLEHRSRLMRELWRSRRR